MKLVGASQSAESDPSIVSLQTMTSEPRFHAEFKAAEGGKTAVSMARWISTRVEKGPWSDIVTATAEALSLNTPSAGHAARE